MNYSNQIIIGNVVKYIDRSVWKEVGNRVVEKNVPGKLKQEMNRILNDFTIQNTHKSKLVEPSSVKPINEQIDTFKENYIIGTSKLFERTGRSKSQHSEPMLRTNGFIRPRTKTRTRTKQVESSLNSRPSRQTKSSKGEKTQSAFFILTANDPINR